MVFWNNPHITGQYNPLYTLKQPDIFSQVTHLQSRSTAILRSKRRSCFSNWEDSNSWFLCRKSLPNPTVLEANGSEVRLQTIKRFTESAKTCTFRKFQVTSKFEKSTFFLPNTHLKRKSKRSHELVGISEFPWVLSVGYSSRIIKIIKVSVIKSTFN